MLLKVTNPATEEVIAHLQAADAPTIAQTVIQARAAQSAWAARPLSERVEIIQTFRARMAEHADTLARTLTGEMGKPLGQALGEVNGTLGRIDFFLEHAASVLADEVVFEAEDGSLTERISREPLGVVANISAWNYPYFVGSNVFVPALLAGNAVVYKPSEYASLTGMAIANLLWESGVPRDIFSLLLGGGEVGAELLRQDIDGVFFTGSYNTGKAINEAVAGKLIKVQLELGGKDPVYILPDVDVAAVAAGVADGAFYNTGQSCCAVERIYVHADIYDAFCDAFVETVKGFTIAGPLEEGAYIGPLTQETQLETLEAQVEDAVEKGATLRCGGEPIDRIGHYFAPTVLTGVDHTMIVMRDESFGPIIGIQRVGGDEEAIALMNDTPYGLTAGVFTPDRDRAESLLRRVGAGSAYWNCCDRVSPRLPWSGRGASGLGLTLSKEGITAFTQPKAWHLRR